MALNINGRMKVKTLKADFKKEFGLTLRVYDGRSFADDDATLASIRKGDSLGGEFAPQRNTKVGNLEDKIMDMFGIKTQVAGSDDSYLCDNDKTLAGAFEADEKLMVMREKRNTKMNAGELEEIGGTKRYFELVISGNGGEYTAGIISDSDEILYLNTRLDNGDLDLMNENLYYDESSIKELPCFEKDNIIHSYGVNCEEDIEVIVKELKSNQAGAYLSNDAIWIGSNNDINTARLYNPNIIDAEEDENALILTSISYEEGLTSSYLIETNQEDFDPTALVFTTTLMDEMMDGISDTIIDNVYYIPKDKLYNYIENLTGNESEIYKNTLKIYKERLDENNKYLIDFIIDLFEELVNERGLNSYHQESMSNFLEDFKLVEFDKDPGESTLIEVKLFDINKNPIYGSGEVVDDDIFDDDDFEWED